MINADGLVSSSPGAATSPLPEFARRLPWKGVVGFDSGSAEKGKKKIRKKLKSFAPARLKIGAVSSLGRGNS